MSTKRDITTVTIDTATAKLLEMQSKASGVSKKEYINALLEYVKKQGVDPIKDESPQAEIAKINKRLDQVVAFMKVQEKDMMIPTFEALTRVSQTLTNKVEHLYTTEQSEEQIKIYIDVLKRVEDNKKMLGGFVKDIDAKQISNFTKLVNAIGVLTKALEEGKDRKGLFDSVKDIFNT